MRKQIFFYVLALLGVVALIYLQKMDIGRSSKPASSPPNVVQVQAQDRPLATKSGGVRELARKAVPYSIEYAANSSIKKIPLKNAKMKVKVYYYDNPDGMVSLSTDENQSFKFGKYKDSNSVALEIVGIDGQEKFNAICYGQTIPGSRKIRISCEHPEV